MQQTNIALPQKHSQTAIMTKKQAFGCQKPQNKSAAGGSSYQIPYTKY